MSFAATAAAHLQRVAWVARDALAACRSRVLLAAGLELAGFSVAMGVLGGIYVYAAALEAGRPPPALLGWPLPAPGDGSAFALTAVAAVLVAVAAAGCVYRAHWLAAEVAMLYQRRCARRVLEAAARHHDLDWDTAFTGGAERSLSRLASSASKQLGIVARSLVQAVLPLAQFVVALGAMLWLEPVLTLLMLPLVVLYMLPLARVNRAVAADQRELNGVARQAHRVLADGIDGALDGDLPTARVGDLADAELPRRAALLFYRRKLADNRMQFFNTVAFVVGLLLVLVYHVLVVGDGEHTWSSMVAYLVMVKLAQGGVRQLTGVVVRISRLTPDFRPYLEFVRGVQALEASPGGGARRWPGAPIPVGAPVRGDDEDDDLDFDD